MIRTEQILWMKIKTPTNPRWFVWLNVFMWIKWMYDVTRSKSQLVGAAAALRGTFICVCLTLLLGVKFNLYPNLLHVSVFHVYTSFFSSHYWFDFWPVGGYMFLFRCNVFSGIRHWSGLTDCFSQLSRAQPSVSSHLTKRDKWDRAGIEPATLQQRTEIRRTGKTLSAH